MNTINFEYMLTLEDTGSITKTAEKHFVSPSAISQCLKKEEKQFNHKLFIRKNHRMVPTPEGRIYLEGARKIVEIRDHTYQHILSFKKDSKDSFHIRIAVAEPLFEVTEGVLLPALNRFFPDSAFELIQTESTSAYVYTLCGLAEIGLLISSFPDRQPIDALSRICLQDDSLVLLVPRDYIREKTHEKPRLEDCHSIPFILTKKGMSSRAYEDQMLAKSGLSESYVYEVNNFSIVKKLLLEGRGAAFLPSSMVPDHFQQKFFLLKLHPVHNLYFYLLYKENNVEGHIWKLSSEMLNVIQNTWRMTDFFQKHQNHAS